MGANFSGDWAGRTPSQVSGVSSVTPAHKARVQSAAASAGAALGALAGNGEELTTYTGNANATGTEVLP